jgi:AcrR family transcriptional regulator
MTRHLPEQTRREQILVAARKCFIERGYYPTRMEDIASAAGLSKGGVYFHFESKGQVFDALVQEEYARSMEFLRTVSGGSESVAEKMQVLARYYLEYFSSTGDATRFFILMGEMGLRDEALSKRILEMQSAYITQVAKLIEQGIEEGMLRPVDARAVAMLLKALLDGVEGLHAMQYPIEIDKLLGVGLELVLGGLVKRS